MIPGLFLRAVEAVKAAELTLVGGHRVECNSSKDAKPYEMTAQRGNLRPVWNRCNIEH
jgi:hypothetical protein